MIQIITKLDEVLSYSWIDCTISITIEIFDSCDFTKTFGQVFHSNEHKYIIENYFHLKDTRIMLETFVSKFICL
jgi:hypothetical protein